MINQDQNINPVVVAFVTMTHQQQMNPNYQQMGAMAAAHQVVTDITCSETGVLFSLLNGSSFSLSYADMVVGLQVFATGSLVTLGYALPMQPAAAGIPVDNLRLMVENRVVALACSPMTSQLIEPLRRAVTGEPQPAERSAFKPTTFDTPLTLRGIAADNFNGIVTIYGYILHENRAVELVISVNGDDPTTMVRSIAEWRQEMTKWAEIAFHLPHEHRVLMSIIKARGQTPQDSTNDIQPRNTVNKYHGRSTPADAAEPTPTDDTTPTTIDVSGMFVTGDGPDGRVHKAPVYSYQIVPQDGQESLIQFFNEEGTMIASAALSHLVLSKYRQTVKGLVVEIMKYSANPSRRATLITHAEKHGVSVMADALKTLKH